MFQRLQAGAAKPAHLDRIEHALRTRFDLPAEEIVLVTQEPGTLAGHPPRLVTIRFWKDGGRFRLRIFKPAEEIGPDDLPASWLLNALKDDGDMDCC